MYNWKAMYRGSSKYKHIHTANNWSRTLLWMFYSGFLPCVNHIDPSFHLAFGFFLWFPPPSLWSTAIPSSDAKNANLYFLDVVQQANSIFHLFDKQFNDQLMPLIRSALGQSLKSCMLPRCWSFKDHGLFFLICLQLISKVGRVPAEEERGDWTDGSETGHGDRQVSMFISCAYLCFLCANRNP